jgi:hypothetical protein
MLKVRKDEILPRVWLNFGLEFLMIVLIAYPHRLRPLLVIGQALSQLPFFFTMLCPGAFVKLNNFSALD